MNGRNCKRKGENRVKMFQNSKKSTKRIEKFKGVFGKDVEEKKRSRKMRKGE